MKRILSLVLAMSALCAFEIDKEKGMWRGLDAEKHHCHDHVLAKGLVSLLQRDGAKSAVDFGCGMGKYIRWLARAGFDCEGYDGNPDTPQLSQGFCKVLDISEPFDLGRKFDWVISIEVGEHIPKKYEKNFVENLMRHCKRGIVISWALKGQRGDGHVNCQNNDYIKDLFASYGYENDLEAEKFIRGRLRRLRYLRRTLMVFRPSAE